MTDQEIKNELAAIRRRIEALSAEMRMGFEALRHKLEMMDWHRRLQRIEDMREVAKPPVRN